MTSKPLTVHLIAAARPNFMKIAPLYHALAREAWCRPQIVHTGQHYDANMSDAFFRYGQRGFQPARQACRPLRTRAGGSRWALAHRAPSGALGRPSSRALRGGAQAAHWLLIKRQ